MDYPCGKLGDCSFSHFGSIVQTKDVSVRAAAAGIIASDFYAALTDSVLPLKIRQRLPAARQRSDSRLTWLFFKMAASICIT